MKYVIFSDLHLHTWNSSYNEEERLPSRLLEQKNILTQVMDITIKQKATLLFGGDIVHSVGKIPVEALNMVDWFFKQCKELGITLYCVEGNHDMSLRENGTKFHSVLSLFQDKKLRDLDLELLNIKFIDYDDKDVESVQKYDIVIIHKQPAIINDYNHQLEGVNWKALESKNRLLFYGHDHTRRILSDKSYVIGCPMHLNKADAGQERGCWIVDSETWSVEFIKLNYTEIKPFTVEEKEAKEVKFEAKIKAVSFQDILIEWLERQEKPKEYLDLIQKDVTDKLQVVKPFFTGKVKSLTVKNILSIENLTVDFKDGLNLIIGKNGSGKSSIFESLMWVLFEETTKSLAKGDVIRNRPTKQKDGNAELVLDGGEEPYIISRSVKNGLEVYKGAILLTEGMGKAQAQEFLEKAILGFDKTVYQAACYFSQEQLTMLAQLGDADTTNMVTNILGFDTYDSLYIDMDLKVKETELKIKSFNDIKAKIENDKWKNEEQQKNLTEQITMFTNQQCSLTDEHLKVTQQIAEKTTLYGNIVVPSVTVEDLDVSLLGLKDAKTQISNKGNLLGLELEKIHNLQHEIEKEELKFKNEVEFTNKLIAKHNDNIAKLEKREFGQRCTHCGALVTKENVQSFIDEEKAAILSIPTAIAVKDYSKLLEETYNKEAEINEELSTILGKSQELDTKINETQKEKDNTLASVIKANTDKENLTLQIRDLNERSVKIKKQLEDINTEEKKECLEFLKTQMSDFDKCLLNNGHLQEVEIKNLEIYEFWKSSFSNKGIRPLLLDKFCHTFNQIIKPLCNQVSHGKFNIEFTPSATTKGGQERNKLGLNIIYKDNSVLYESLSGGEKTRCNLPLCFGLNKFITQQYKIKGGLLGIMILDELFANVDHEGEEDIASFLNLESKDKYIGVITHSDELISYSNNVWKVIKKNDVTTIEV